MWLGMELRRLADGVSCYPNGYNTGNTKVDPADEGAPIVRGNDERDVPVSKNPNRFG